MECPASPKDPKLLCFSSFVSRRRSCFFSILKCQRKLHVSNHIEYEKGLCIMAKSSVERVREYLQRFGETSTHRCSSLKQTVPVCCLPKENEKLLGRVLRTSAELK